MTFPLPLFLTDLPVSSVVALVGSTAFTQTSLSVCHHRSHIDGRRLVPLLVSALVSQQLGVWTLYLIEGLYRISVRAFTENPYH